MRFEIIVDNFGLEAREPISNIVRMIHLIAALPDTFVYENDEIWLDLKLYSDIDDTSLTFTVTSLTNEEN